MSVSGVNGHHHDAQKMHNDQAQQNQAAQGQEQQSVQREAAVEALQSSKDQQQQLANALETMRQTGRVDLYA